MAQTQMMATTTAAVRFPLRALAAVLAAALVGRALLLASGSVSFHSDEAVVALMARHILQGERPVFFYGQAYMGSLDSWLVAAGFRLFGESVTTIRIVQAALYLLVVTTGFAAAWRLSGRVVTATAAGLTLAVPPVLVAVYTTATLGGYNETLLFGNLLVILGYDVAHAHRRSWGRWALLGLVAGVGWWTNGLIAAYALPVGLMALYRLIKGENLTQVRVDTAQRHRDREAQRKKDGQRAQGGASLQELASQAGNPGKVDLETAATMPTLRERAWLAAAAAAGFFVGSAPWWVFNFEHEFAALAFYFVRTNEGPFAGNDVPALPLEYRVLGLLFLGLPTLIGLRFPWQPEIFAPLVGSVVVFIYGAAIYRLARGATTPEGAPPLKPDGRALVLGMLAVFCALFFVSKFSIDPTGRYFLPLALPLGIALGTLADTVRRLPRRAWQVGIVGVVLAYYAAGQISAASAPAGLTTQFNLDSHLPNDYDDELIAWLDAHGIYAGYTTYWVAFRLAFLSDERMQFSSALPYKPSLDYTPADERYPAYKDAADSTDNAAYITANVQEVRERMEAVFAESGISYEKAVVGPYHIYYDFQPYTPRPPLPLNED